MLYTESDLEKSMDKIETIHFHQVCFNLQLHHYIIVTHDIQSSISSSFLFFCSFRKKKLMGLSSGVTMLVMFLGQPCS